MGVATDYVKKLKERPLTSTEEEERQNAEEISDPDAESTLEGDIVKEPASSAPKVIEKRKTATWD